MAVNIKDSSGNNLSSTSNALNVYIAGEDEGNPMLGFYTAHYGLQSIVQTPTAHTSTQLYGLAVLYNPYNSGVNLFIERIKVTSSAGITAASTTAARLLAGIFQPVGSTATIATPTGVATRCLDTRLSRSASAQAGSSNGTTALTGNGSGAYQLVPLNATVWSTILPSMISGTTAGVFMPFVDTYIPRESEYEVCLTQGYGLLVWQADAGVGSDSRRVALEINWEEKSAA